MCKSNRIWYHPDLIGCAKEFRKNPTKAESRLWQRLRGEQVKGYKFLRQKPLLYYIVDFYCPKLKLAIEVDGSIHKIEDVANRDAIRSDVLSDYGVKILRFSNHEILTDIRSVVWEIEDWIERNGAGSGL